MGLLEREDELSVLDEFVRGAFRGEGRVAVLAGPPGIGKTALLAAVRHRAGARVRALTAVGGELERDLPFGIVRQLFESTVHAGDDADALCGAAGLAAPVFASDSDARAIAALGDVVHGLYWLCANLAEKLPLLLVVDDLQWADDASLRFLSHLARRIDGLPILVLAAGRSGTALDDLMVRVLGGIGVDTIALNPLSLPAVSTLVRQRLGGDADDAFCAACAAASGGNPFLLTEALDALGNADVRPTASEVARVTRLRPQTISRAVLSRIARLGPETVRFARALSILGPNSPRQLGEFADLSADAVVDIADALARDSILAADHPIEFVHPLVREAVYGDMSALQRDAEHKRAAHLLETDSASIEHVAAQLQATAPGSDAWVVAALRQGAAAALARGAPESAVNLLMRAREEPPHHDDLRLVDAELARSLGNAGRLSEAASMFHIAIDESDDDANKLALALELTGVMARAGRGRETVEAIELARHFIDWDDPDLPDALQAVFGIVSLLAMEPPSKWTARLDRVVARTASDNQFDRMVFSTAAFAGAVTGDRPATEVIRLARRGAAGPVPEHDGGALVNMAASALAISGDVAEAFALIDRGIDNARALGNRSEFAYLAVLRSHIACHAGQLLEAEADARAALSDVRGEAPRMNTSLAAAVLIEALAERGAVADAAEVLRAFELDGELHVDALIEYLVPMARGALRLVEHKPADALQDFLDCGHTLTSHGYTNPGFAQWRAGAVAAYVALGHTAPAVAVAEENLDLARAFGAPGPLAIALRMAARATSAGTRLEYLTEAAEVLATVPDLLEHAHVLVEYGTELCRVGDKTAARAPLMDGLDFATRFDARPLVAIAQRELRLIGLRPRRTATTGRDALTASEVRVASLAADGATNRQIAQALFVTTRTVEVHLTNAYRKLNIDNRGELATALAQPRPAHGRVATGAQAPNSLA